MRRLTVLVLVVAGLGSAPRAASADEVPTCHGLVATIVGTEGNDVLRGTAGDDVIVGLGGNDVLRPGPGDDTVCGGPGSDSLISRRGADWLHGGGQRDRIDAHSPLPTVVHGGAGDDFLFFSVPDAPGYVLDGGVGPDILDISPLQSATVDAAVEIRRGPGTFSRAGVVTGTYLGIEELGLNGELAYAFYGSKAPDYVFVSSPLPFLARTGHGPDKVWSSDGDDIIDVGRGDDRVDAGVGSDVCVGAEHAKNCESRQPSGS